MKVPSERTETVPLAGLLAVKVSGSLSASAAFTTPVATPLTGLGVEIVAVAVGAELRGETGRVTTVVACPPAESVTVTVTVSVVTDVGAPTLAAAWRAAAVGV